MHLLSTSWNISKAVFLVLAEKSFRFLLLPGSNYEELHTNRASVAHLVVHRAVAREVVSSRLRPDQHSGSLSN